MSKEVVEWLDNHNIKNYVVNSDCTVDINGSVNLGGLQSTSGTANYTGIMPRTITKFEVQFRKIYGDFNCSYQFLHSLEGCPEWVEGDFNCSANPLVETKYFPKYVGGRIYANKDFLMLKKLEDRLRKLKDLTE